MGAIQKDPAAREPFLRLEESVIAYRGSYVLATINVLGGVMITDIRISYSSGRC